MGPTRSYKFIYYNQNGQHTYLNDMRKWVPLTY